MELGIACWGLVTITSPAEQVILLLVAGHLVGDFLVQSRATAEGKREKPVALALHAFSVAIAHLVALLPFAGIQVVVAAATIGAVHGLVDLVKSRWRRARPNPIALLVADQAVHLAF